MMYSRRLTSHTSDGWDAGYAVSLTNGVVLARTVTRDPYRRSLVTAITNGVDGVPVNPLAYGYDALNRVISRNVDAFGYNSRSEVTSATIQPGSTNGYAYDGIGNALWASLSAATNAYTANALNQYTDILRASASPREILPTYDLDGNLLTNGAWSYAWDAENRLVVVYSNSLCVVSNAYDHMNRRVLKVTPTTTCTYLYDGWNLIQETIQDQYSTLTNLYVWGKDLSGTMQGAGGIGGLIAVSIGGAWYFPLYDNNGNITAYADESGTLVAEYLYDAFGHTIAQSGPLADVFPHRFSTKYWDADTGLYYYGYRFYSPELGRWLSRDPIGEEGGNNLYRFVANSPIWHQDAMGLCELVSAGIRYRVSIDSLDSHQTGTPYRDMANWARSYLDGSQMRHALGMQCQQLISSGPFTASNPQRGPIPAGYFVAGNFLFFVDWEVCEKNGPCSIRTSQETVTVVKDGLPLGTMVVPADTPRIGNSWTKNKRRDHDWVTIVYVDAPGDIAVVGPAANAPGAPQPQGFSLNAKYQVQLMDGNTVLDTVDVDVNVGVDKNGIITATP